tara:strand:+ start:6661 stop:7449 length:789 start_codon:yes stop_codon:yes gene_type:complete
MADQKIADFLKSNNMVKTKGRQATNQLILPPVNGGDPDTLNVTEAEMNRFLIDQWKESKKDKKEKTAKENEEASKPIFSITADDSTEIKGKSLSELKKEGEAYEGMTGKKLFYEEPEKPEKVDESAKRDKWMKTIMELQDKMNKTAIDTAGDTTYAMPQNIFNMAQGQQAALTDSVNFSYGREAIKSPENWGRFMQKNPEPDTGKTIEQTAQDKYMEILEEVKKLNMIRPEMYEEEARERTQMWLNTYLKDKYNIDYNAATN